MEARANQSPDEILLKTLDSINLEQLKSTKHSNYVAKLTEIIGTTLRTNSVLMFVVLDELKHNAKPCYKRDTLIEVLNKLVNSRESTILHDIILQPFNASQSENSRRAVWKKLANCIATMPDLMANLGVIDNYPAFQKQTYYPFLVSVVYKTLKHMTANNRDSLPNVHKFFILQLLGRVAMSSSSSQLVWQNLMNAAIQEEVEQSGKLRQFIASILNSPFESYPNESIADNGNNNEHSVIADCDEASTTFELFANHLYLPIFYHLKPGKQNGDTIRSLIGNCVLQSEHFKFIVCDKAILKANYKLDRTRQAILLTNIFAYLASLVDGDKMLACAKLSPPTTSCRGTDDKLLDTTKSLLIETLLEIVDNWSNSTKILLRVYEQNRYLSMALLIAFKYALEFDRSALLERANKIQSAIIRAIPTYLNRASPEQRNLAMCLSELVLPKLHELIMRQSGAKTGTTSGDMDLKFDADFGDDLCQLQELFKRDLADDSYYSGLALDLEHDCQPAGKGENCAVAVAADGGEKKVESSTGEADERPTRTKLAVAPAEKLRRRRAIRDVDDLGRQSLFGQDVAGVEELEEESVNEDDDAAGADDDEDDDDDDDDDVFDSLGQDSLGVPMYLHECLAGLIENSNARFVRLCLIKLSELLNQLLDCQAVQNEKALQLYKEQLSNRSHSQQRAACKSGEPDINDTVRDVAVELAQVLYYLDNQFNLSDFDALRLKALTLLCISAPDLVAKYLIEQFNAPGGGLGRQLGILQTLVASAKHLAAADGGAAAAAANATTNNTREEINRFAKYGSLYFYGIVYRLQSEMSAIYGGASRRLGGGEAGGATPVAPAFSLTARPETLVAAKRNFIDDGRSLIIGGAGRRSDASRLQARRRREPLLLRQSKNELEANRSTSATTTTTTTGREINSASNADVNEDQQETQEDFCSSEVVADDDSYLLSRILFSISSVMGCLRQQPITCRLATDLLDILAAYRCHPDPGVRGALVVCLKAARECTPSAYFRDNLEPTMMRLFGQWLSEELETATK